MEPSTDPTTIYTLSVRKPGLTFTEYKSHYESTHVPLVHRLIMTGENRPLSYSRNYIERDNSSSTQSFPMGGAEAWGYDCIARTTFRDVAHRDAVFKEFEKHKEEIQADEEKFLDRGKLLVLFVSEGPSIVRT